MGARGETLAKQFEAKAQEVTAAIERLSDAEWKIFADKVPLGRIGEPDHISKTVLFLASDDAAHVQGQELFVDGGATASPSGAPIYRG